MKPYLSDIVESYKDKIIGHLVKLVTSDLLSNIVQCWRACEVGKDNRDLPVVL